MPVTQPVECYRVMVSSPVRPSRFSRPTPIPRTVAVKRVRRRRASAVCRPGTLALSQIPLTGLHQRLCARALPCLAGRRSTQAVRRGGVGKGKRLCGFAGFIALAAIQQHIRPSSGLASCVSAYQQSPPLAKVTALTLVYWTRFFEISSRVVLVDNSVVSRVPRIKEKEAGIPSQYNFLQFCRCGEIVRRRGRREGKGERGF